MITQNQIKHIRSLHLKKFRDEHRQFIAEGPKIIGELLAGKHPISMLFGSKEWIENNQSRLNTDNIEIVEVNEKELGRISCFSAPNQVLAVLNIPETRKITDENLTGMVLALDQINDPGNLGTIIRTADWFGIKNIICSKSCVELYNPKVIQATMGSFLNVKVSYCDLEKLFQEKQGTLNVYGAYTNGIALDKIGEKTNSLIIIGNESKGISINLEKYLIHKIMIPSRNKTENHHAESLNASIATALICYEFTK